MHVTKMLEYCNLLPEVTVGSFTVVFIARTEYSMLVQKTVQSSCLSFKLAA